MPEQENVSANGQPTEKKTKKKVTRSPFGSVEQANAGKPSNKYARLFRVAAPDGSVSFVWAGGTNEAVGVAAKAANWSAAQVGKDVSKEKVGNLLAQLSQEDRAILIAQYVPATTGKKK